MKLRLAVFFVIAIVSFECRVPSVAAQGWDPARSTGAPPTVYDVSSVDDVDMTNGNLRIRIPLLQLNGRGPDTSVSITYNSKIWMSQQVSNDPSLPPVVVTSLENTSWYLLPGWQFGMMDGLGSGSTTCVPDPTGSYCQVCYYYQEVLARDGTRIPTNAVGSDPSCATTPAMYSFDGTFVYSPPTSSLPSFVFKDGTSIKSVSTTTQVWQWEDTNGNLLTQTSSGTPPTITVTDTLGRTVNLATGSGGLPVTLSYLDSSGATRTVTFGYTSYTIYFPYLAGCYTEDERDTNRLLLTSLTLPNGLSYAFQYVMNSDGSTTGELSKITFPTGGYARYGYTFAPVDAWQSCFQQSPYQAGQNRVISTRTVSSDGTTGSEKTWTYTFTGTQTTVVDPLGNIKVAVPVPQSNVVTEVDYKNPAGTLLEKETFTYQCNSKNGYTMVVAGPLEWCDNPQYLTKTTTLADINEQSKQTFTYDAYNNPAEKDEYDWGNGSPGALIRKTTYTYLHNSNSAYAAANVHILDRQTSKVVYDSGGCARAQTSAAYDGSSLTGTSNVVQHDYTNFSSSNLLRGNVTQRSERLSAGSTTGSCSSSGSWLNTTNAYNDLGLVTQTTDPLNNMTQFSYSDNFYNFTPSKPTLAFVTRMTYPATNGTSHVTRAQYYFNSSLVAAECGLNFNPSASCSYGLTPPQSDYVTYTYDLMNRRLVTSQGDGGKNTLAYNESALPITVTSTTAINNTTNLITQAVYDGLGRSSQTQVTTDPDGADYTVTTYDALGRTYQAYNPTRCNPPTTNCGESTWGLTSYVYDALGRTTQTTNPDNSSILATYTGRATQFQDEGNGTRRVTRISQTDALGRLVSACEVTSTSQLGSSGTPAACGQDVAGTGFLTTYSYDVLDNLTSVAQSGLNTRTFQYDSLSRLTSAYNPESGTTSYAYDNNGNVLTKTDARSIQTRYSYDALNRLIGKNYSDGTPAATFNYDQSSALGVTLTNTIGRESSVSTGGSSPTGSVFSYDSMGRVADNSQCTPQNCGTGVFAFQYPQYDFLGDLVLGTNAAGVSFTYSYNGAARLTSMTTNFVDASHPGTLFSSAHYAPFGPLTSSTLGNSLNESLSYDKRLREQSYSATSGSTTPFSFNIGSYAPNGDTLAANDSVNGNWAYSYDDFNRLSGSNQNNGQAVYSYAYDRFGNRWQQNGPRSMQLSFSGANNRMDGHSYDAAGNLLNDGSHSYFYDAENRLTQVDGTLGNCSTATACYVYDAEGRRVRKATASGTLDSLYDAQGHKVAEVDTTGTFQRGELYAGGRHLAVYAPDPGPTGATFFIHADWLGTERARTNLTGAACETIKSLPFGDGQTISDSCGDSAGDVSPMHFTGEPRDTESNLDYFGARYNSSQFGRFMSPDWSDYPEPIPYAEFTDPQSFDLYSYTMNNPTTSVDPDGHFDEEPFPPYGITDVYNRQAERILADLPKPGARCGLLCRIWRAISGPGGQSVPAPSRPEIPFVYNTIAGAVNFSRSLSYVVSGNQRLLDHRMPYMTPTNKADADALEGLNLALLFVPGPDVEELAAQLARGLKPLAEGKELQAIIDELYQVGDKLAGGTAGAVRQELKTGVGVGGRFHSLKAAERARQLIKLIASGKLSARDLVLAKAIVLDLLNARAGL